MRKELKLYKEKIMYSYLKKTKELYLNMEEWIADYKPFLKHAFSKPEKDVNWYADPYNDPDSKKTNSEEFYRAMTDFLKAQEKFFQKKELLTGEFVYAFDILSSPYIEVKEIGKDESSFYLKSDQFGFSAPSEEKSHPYDTYILQSILNGKNIDNAIENVARWVYESRTIGGSFLWPLEVDQERKFIERPSYNITRGGSCKGGTYIEDRVDLTLLEIMMVLEDKENNKVKLRKYFGNDTNMKKWLKHFKSFDVYASFFCFDESFFVQEKGIKNIIASNNIEKNDYIVLREKDIGERKIYEVHRGPNKSELLLSYEELEKMLKNVNLLINKRTEKMENIINNFNEKRLQ